MLCNLKVDDEAGRLSALRRYAILDSEEDRNFDTITRLVKDVLGCPVAAVSLVDAHRQWFKSVDGFPARKAPRGISFCDHTIRDARPMLIEDARTDPRFAANPLVTGAPFIQSYAGAPLTTAEGYNLGALCAIDFKPRRFSQTGIALLSRFAQVVVDQLELRTLAHRDFLTDVLTRRAFTDAVESALDQLERDMRPGALILFDIDHFKTINDEYGHPTGDRVLKAIAEACKAEIRPSDLFARLGGEEFAIFLYGAGSAAALVCAERIRRMVESLALSGCGPFTISCGIAESRAGFSLDLLLAEADVALYSAKRSGRNRSVAGNVMAAAA